MLFSGVEDKIGSVIRAKLEEMTNSQDFEIYRPISVLDDRPGPNDDMGHLQAFERRQICPFVHLHRHKSPVSSAPISN